jgi:hypothetical protein
MFRQTVQTIQTTRCVRSGQIYQHYKGTAYKVLCIAKHTETEEEMVVYQRTVQSPDLQIWTRPIRMFNEKVPINGTYKERFTLVKD